MTAPDVRMVAENGHPVLGVLGGMGPGATNDFLARLAHLTPADRDQDHVPTLVYSDPSTPDRSDAILQAGPSPLPAMLRGIAFLNRAGCDAIAIPCNSAHYWYDDLTSASAAPIPHITDATAAELQRISARTVGLMATDGTCKSGIYSSRLAQFDMATVDLTDLNDENPIMQGIRAYKAGDTDQADELLHEGAHKLIDRGANALTFACTDVSAALTGVSAVGSTPVVDASECLARTCVARLTPAKVTPSGEI